MKVLGVDRGGSGDKPVGTRREALDHAQLIGEDEQRNLLPGWQLAQKFQQLPAGVKLIDLRSI